MTPAQRDAIRAQVATWPALTDTDRDALAAMLRPTQKPVRPATRTTGRTNNTHTGMDNR